MLSAAAPGTIRQVFRCSGRLAVAFAHRQRAIPFMGPKNFGWSRLARYPADAHLMLGWMLLGTLPPDWRPLAKRVAACRTLLSLNAIADECSGGQLDRHSKDRRFVSDPTAERTTARGAKYKATKVKKSGIPGNLTRKRQLEDLEYARASERPEVQGRERCHLHF